MSGRASREGGFLLVGVIIFVLALTILGMSLYSLSSYESGFQLNSRDSNTAFYDAQAGLVMVQALLAAPPNRLSSAGAAVGHWNIEYATATQRLNSTGAVDWGDTVTVVVRTRVQGQSHTLRARYFPRPRRDLYRRLFTISGLSPVDVTTLDAGGPRLQTYRISDARSAGWLNSADTTWALSLNWTSRPPFKIGNVPDPDAQNFYLLHSGAPAPPAWNLSPPGMTIGTWSSSDVTFLESTNAGAYNFDPDAGLFPPQGGTIRVAGTVVWMLQHGFASDGLLRLERAPGGAGQPATLVLVGSPHPLPSPRTSELDVGINFHGGLDVDPDVNVILVSDGTISLSQSPNNGGDNYQAGQLSIYCNKLSLTGPIIPHMSTLDYGTQIDAAIDFLESQDALPHGAGVAPGIFTLLPGSWRDLTP